MNLVIDDAVEVKLASKTEEEQRRDLGKWFSVQLLYMEVLIYKQARSC